VRLNKNLKRIGKLTKRVIPYPPKLASLGGLNRDLSPLP
jgi:hypothetical protein